MKQRDIWSLQIVGSLLIAGACGAGLLVLLALSGCSPAVIPGPVPPDPGPPPAGTPCERACKNAVALGCSYDLQLCTKSCERHETLGGSSSRNPECQAKATTCEQLAACRGGT